MNFQPHIINGIFIFHISLENSDPTVINGGASDPSAAAPAGKGLSSTLASDPNAAAAPAGQGSYLI